MPKVVDKEAVKQEILEAFHRLSMDRPLTDISLREIASEAGISHSSILRYFHDKQSILIACVHWAGRSFLDNVEHWFEQNHLSDYSGMQAYLDAFFSYFQREEACQISAQDIVMTCALGAYHEEIKEAVRAEFEGVVSSIKTFLERETAKKLAMDQVMPVFVLFFGIYFTSFSKAIPEGMICTPIAGLGKLFDL